jgi:conjugative transposon TraK protein
MLKQMKNIETAFKHIRLFSFVLLAAAVCISCYAVFHSLLLVEKMQSRIYILANGKALEAISAERKDNVPVEARDHVKSFHYYFFSLSPDDKAIQANIDKALNLADASARKKYSDLKEAGFYTGILNGNVSQEITTDSIQVDVNQSPFYFKYYGKLKITRATVVVTRNLLTEGWLRNTQRSDNNPHGFLIERWSVIDNSDLKTEKR